MQLNQVEAYTPSSRSHLAMMAGFGNASPKPSRVITPLPESLCLCGSGATYDSCCGPYHSNRDYPSNAVAMVRSRFSALALKNIAYIISTTHPEHEEYVSEERSGARRQWEKDLNAFVDEYDFLSLTFENEAQASKENNDDKPLTQSDDDGHVSISFSAKLKRAGLDRIPEEMKETSVFKVLDGKLLYYDAIIKASLKRNTSSRPVKQQQRKVTVAKGVRKSNQ